MLYICFFFFFSSRRRHTRLTCDWSSDVCSSDLHVSTSVGGRSTVDRRPKQGVAERNSRTDSDEIGRFGRSSRFDRKAKHGSGLPKEHWIAGRFGRTEEQQALRLLG